jgi:hypothetical protein
MAKHRFQMAELPFQMPELGFQTCSNAVPKLVNSEQDVFALLVPSLLTSCQRLVDNLLQGC